jgi:hypothetical protein
MREDNVTQPMTRITSPQRKQGLVMSWVSSSSGSLFGRRAGTRERPGESVEGWINAVKLLRACGGCLGARRRRRAWKTAISPGELSNEL